MNLTRLILAAALACTLCGCGTINNSISMYYFQKPAEPNLDEPPPNYVYGGIKCDAIMVRDSFTSKESIPTSERLLGFAHIADIPLSAVFDTLYLPRTIYGTREQREWWRQARSDQQRALAVAERRSKSESPDATR